MKKDPVKALHLESWWARKRPKKRRKEALQCNIIATGLMHKIVKNGKAGCKNRLTDAYGENNWAPGIGHTLLEQNNHDDKISLI